VVANCASCHGIHNILPSTDPGSQTHAANLVSTCGKCHPGATENFAIGTVHLDVPLSQDLSSKATRWVQRTYIVLIIVVIGAMVVHNGLIWRKKALLRMRDPDRTVVRLTSSQRLQHWLLLTSFIVLAITGFALKYPDSWIAVLLGSSEAIRRLGHRVAGVVMLLAGAYHLAYIIGSSEGRQAVRDLYPRRKDISDLVRNVRHYAGGRIAPARIGRFGYAEKAEYWAVAWGVLIMGLTGAMVWFKVEVFGFLPRWLIDAALAVHFYEAILATLSIVIWHFYHVIFDPDVYPVSWAFWDGKVSASHYQHEHPLDVRKVADEGDEQGNRIDKEPVSQDAPAADGKIS
jgi:cytochrome b subunit of formate dehydrogenase